MNGRLPVALVLEGPLGVAQEDAEGRLVVAHAGGDGGGGGDAGQGRPGRQPPPQRVRDPASCEEASVAPQQGRARFLLPEAGRVQQTAARQSRVSHQCRQSIRPGSRRALGRGYQERLGHLFLARVLAGGAIGRSVRALEGEATAAIDSKIDNCSGQARGMEQLDNHGHTHSLRATLHLQMPHALHTATHTQADQTPRTRHHGLTPNCQQASRTPGEADTWQRKLERMQKASTTAEHSRSSVGVASGEQPPNSGTPRGVLAALALVGSAW